MDKCIITVAPTGGMHGKERNPNLPEQPDEIIRDVYECYQEGAAIVHLHTRDKQGKPSQDLNTFLELKEGIRAKTDMVIQFSTGGGIGFTHEQRLSVVEGNPEMASLNCSVNSRGGDIVVVNTQNDIERYARAMLERNIKPEMEVYQPGMFVEVENLIQKGLVKPPYLVNIIFGVRSGIQPSIENFLCMKNNAPEGCIFNAFAVGPKSLLITTLSILTGGHVRVGMEDNIYYRRGELVKSNAQFVARAARLIRELGREVASPAEAREILGLPSLKK